MEPGGVKVTGIQELMEPWVSSAAAVIMATGVIMAIMAVLHAVALLALGLADSPVSVSKL